MARRLTIKQLILRSPEFSYRIRQDMRENRQEHPNEDRIGRMFKDFQREIEGKFSYRVIENLQENTELLRELGYIKENRREIAIERELEKENR